MMSIGTELIDLKDDGIIPNSTYPVLIYRTGRNGEGVVAADFLEETFAKNGWSNAFRWGIYDYHHYHSNTHEVLGVYQGSAELQLGGPAGKKLSVKPGDILILPAGTGHIALRQSPDFAVVGAYPEGKEPDLIRIDDPRPDGVREIVEKIPIPKLDPWYGDAHSGLVDFWRKTENG